MYKVRGVKGSSIVTTKSTMHVDEELFHKTTTTPITNCL